MSNESLVRSVGLPAATFIIVGYVIGASIFILPGSMAADVGPAVFVAYAIAAIPAIIAGFVMAQLGTALPVSGAIYVLLRDVLSPFSGFLYLWIMVSLGAVIIPLVAFGFADYLGYFVNGLDRSVVAASVVVGFVFLNGLGMKVAATAQSLMVIGLLAVLAVFGVAGVLAGDADLLQPLFPKGYSPLTLAAITAYFSYAGVFVIAEIAGEVREPARNIPLAILFAFTIIALLYTLVPLALSMLIPWQEHGDTSMAVVTASQIFLPKPVVTLVAVAALIAAATSVNGVMMGLSRDFYQGATGGVFPAWFAEIGTRTHAPVRTVVLVGTLSLVGVAVGGAITSYAQLALIGLMIIQIMTGVALIRLPSVLPQVYERSSLKIGRRWLWFISLAYIVFSLCFLILLAGEAPQLLVVGLVFIAAGVAYHTIRTQAARRNKTIRRSS